MKHKINLFILLLFFINLTTACADPQVCFSLKVIDEETEEPIENADAVFYFYEIRAKPFGAG
ncbi:MAG: hypothetical protein ACRC37_01285, partial [Lentisphaeria bacterium]